MSIENIFKLSATKLKSALRNKMLEFGYDEIVIHNTKDFLYIEGDAPYMLVAHLDTVHKSSPSIICYSKDGNYMMSPQGIGGDDRCGVYIILTLLAKLPFKPYVLFTMDEEIGGLGASAFINDYMVCNDIPDLKYIVEYDRKGNDDCVFYDCDNEEFVNFVEQFGFTESYGTFSDISVIAPELGVAAVNLSSGYYNPHTEHEYVSFNDMHDIIEKSLKMLNTDCEQFIYKKKAYRSFGSSQYYSGYEDVSVCYVPENSVCVYDATIHDWRPNEAAEVVTDAEGRLYKLSTYYRDYVSINFYPIEDDFVPEYDAENAVTVQVYNWYY